MMCLFGSTSYQTFLSLKEASLCPSIRLTGAYFLHTCKHKCIIDTPDRISHWTIVVSSLHHVTVLKKEHPARSYFFCRNTRRKCYHVYSNSLPDSGESRRKMEGRLKQGPLLPSFSLSSPTTRCGARN